MTEKKSQKNIKSRSYCLTIWDKPDMTILPPGVRYVIYGREVCPTTKKIHYQSYIETFGSQRISFHRKLFGKSVHAEVRKGTREEARDYCKKDKDFIELGRWISGQGHRSDLEEIAASLVEGKRTLTQVMEESPTVYCKYRNGIRDLAALGTKKKTNKFRKVKVVVLSGPTGCGKTREAMEHCQYKTEGRSLKWWQDYCGEDSILIDEYNNDVGITEMLNILDGYQLRLNVKGSHTYANWTTVYITTNLKKDEFHINAKQAHKDALFRRITEWKDLWPSDEINGNGDEVPPGNTKNWGSLTQTPCGVFAHPYKGGGVVDPVARVRAQDKILVSPTKFIKKIEGVIPPIREGKKNNIIAPD